MQSRKLLQGRPIPIDASVILLFLSDVEGGSSSPCAKMVDRAMEFKGRSINFFVTAYYADDNNDSRADRLGWKKSVEDKSFRAMTPEYVAAYKAGLQVSNASILAARLLDAKQLGNTDPAGDAFCTFSMHGTDCGAVSFDNMACVLCSWQPGWNVLCAF